MAQRRYESETPVANWERMIFRLPPELREQLADRLHSDREKFQGVMLLLVRAYLAEAIDLEELRAALDG